MDYFVAVRVFLYASDLGSFNRAADQVGVKTSTVSRWRTPATSRTEVRANSDRMQSPHWTRLISALFFAAVVASYMRWASKIGVAQYVKVRQLFSGAFRHHMTAFQHIRITSIAKRIQRILLGRHNTDAFTPVQSAMAAKISSTTCGARPIDSSLSRVRYRRKGTPAHSVDRRRSDRSAGTGRSDGRWSPAHCWCNARRAG